MQQQYKHLIITRFNIKTSDSQDYRLNIKYLKYRFELFEKYCLPSIKGQTCQLFSWLLLLDEQTPAYFKEKINSYKKQYNNINPIYLPPCSNAKDIYVTICNRCAAKTDYLITTRIDNDDVLHKNYIQEIQEYFSSHHISEPTVISFSKGIQYYHNKDIALHINYPSNHFITLIEPTSISHNSVLGYDHTKIKKLFPLIIIKKVMWLEVVHDTNIINNYSLKLHPSIFNVKKYAKAFPRELSSVTFLKNVMGLFRLHISLRCRQIKKLCNIIKSKLFPHD